MSGFNPQELMDTLKDTVEKLLQTPGGLKHLGIPDVVRVSPTIYAGIQAQTPGVPSPIFPIGVKIELDEDLKGEQWELGPKLPSEAQPSDGNAEAPAT